MGFLESNWQKNRESDKNALKGHFGFIKNDFFYLCDFPTGHAKCQFFPVSGLDSTLQ